MVKPTGLSDDSKLARRRPYDVIVVGARLAGAATAMLLARRGFRVLVVDRRRPDTDTLSTHALMRGGVLQLQRWRLLEPVIRAGTPAVRRTVMHYGDGAEVIPIKPKAGIDALYAPRRTVLDSILVDAAVKAGAEVRFGVSVSELLEDDTGRVIGVAGRNHGVGGRFEARGRYVVGADGMYSTVARQTGASAYLTGETSSAFIYGYWSGVPVEGYEFFYRPGASAGFIPTNEAQICVWAAVPTTRFMSDFRADIKEAFFHILDEAAPSAFDRLRSGRRIGGSRSFPGMPGFLRQSWGPGWALVGDAGYFKDPLSTHGMTDAMRDAELLARALGSALDGEVSEEKAFDVYQETRDRLSRPLLTVSDHIASYRWNISELRGLLIAMSKAMTAEVEELANLDPMQSAVAA